MGGQFRPTCSSEGARVLRVSRGGSTRRGGLSCEPIAKRACGGKAQADSSPAERDQNDILKKRIYETSLALLTSWRTCGETHGLWECGRKSPASQRGRLQGGAQALLSGARPRRTSSGRGPLYLPAAGRSKPRKSPASQRGRLQGGADWRACLPQAGTKNRAS